MIKTLTQLQISEITLRAINNYETGEKNVRPSKAHTNSPDKIKSSRRCDITPGKGGWGTWGTVWWLMRNHLRKGEDSHGDGVWRPVDHGM